MSAIEQIVKKPLKEMTAIEYLIYEKYIQWNQNGRPKDPRNDKAGHDAIQSAAELAAMQARIEALEEVARVAWFIELNRHYYSFNNDKAAVYYMDLLKEKLDALKGDK